MRKSLTTDAGKLCDDEREDRRARAQSEVLLADERQHAALESEHATDERVQPHEERELTRVRT